MFTIHAACPTISVTKMQRHPSPKATFRPSSAFFFLLFTSIVMSLRFYLGQRATCRTWHSMEHTQRSDSVSALQDRHWICLLWSDRMDKMKVMHPLHGWCLCKSLDFFFRTERWKVLSELQCTNLLQNPPCMGIRLQKQRDCNLCSWPTFPNASLPLWNGTVLPCICHVRECGEKLDHATSSMDHFSLHEPILSQVWMIRLKKCYYSSTWRNTGVWSTLSGLASARPEK